MAIEDIVDVLTRYMRRVPDPSRTGSELGDPVLNDMRTFLRRQFRDHSGHVALWDDFERDPLANQDDLIGALEAIEEGKPDIGLMLNAYMQEYHQVVNSANVAEQTEVTDHNENPETGDSPGEMTTIQDQVDDFYEGTYITGNVERGTESEGQPIGLDDDPLDDLQRAEDLGMQITDLPGLFHHVYEAARQHPDIDDDTRSKIGSYLRNIEAQVEQQEEADQDIILRQLTRIQKLSPDIVELLLSDEEFARYVEGRLDSYVEEEPE